MAAGNNVACHSSILCNAIDMKKNVTLTMRIRVNYLFSHLIIMFKDITNRLVYDYEETIVCHFASLLLNVFTIMQ